MTILNLGILAHVDAGKTSLTERLLHSAGVIDQIGSVDAGSTQTDSLALERQRGITIRSAVVSFVIGDVTINLIDTPGHPDFIAEVDRVLSVLDGAVLVVSAVEGVQAQTRVLMRALQRLRLPTLIFVNKIDRRGARDDDLVREIATRLDVSVLAMGAVTDLGARSADVLPRLSAQDLTETLADHDDELLASWVAGDVGSYDELWRRLAEQTRRTLLHPVYFGSAATGAGVPALIHGLQHLLPPASTEADRATSGTVFKVERGPTGEKVGYVRMFSGAVHLRERVQVGAAEQKTTGLAVFDQGRSVQRTVIRAGEIGKLWGLGNVRIGDSIGVRHCYEAANFAPPTLETVVDPLLHRDKGRLHVALSQLAEQDPLINVRQDDLRQEISVSLYGEVQKEVIEATLAAEFDLAVRFRETTTICVERPIGTGSAYEMIGVPPNPFRSTIGLRIEPLPVGGGVSYRLGVELGSMPASWHLAIEETVRAVLGHGLYGWQVTDCLITLTHSGFKPPPSSVGDARNLTPLVLMDALREAGTMVCEPIQHFRLELPGESLGRVLPLLTSLRALPLNTGWVGRTSLVEGDIPADQVHTLMRLLPELTGGEGVLETGFDRYQPVPGRPPTRARSDHNPLNRKEYLLHVVRRVPGQDG